MERNIGMTDKYGFWLRLKENNGYEVNCQNIKRLEIIECPALSIEIWFTDSKESDLSLVPYDLRDAKKLKKTFNVGKKLSFIQPVF